MTQSLMSLFSNKFVSKNDHCDRHGPYTNVQFLDRWVGCPECISDTPPCSKEEFELEQRRKKAKLSKCVADANIPQRYRDSRFDSYIASTENQKIVLSAVSSYASDFSGNISTQRSMIFVGNMGTGKTHLACSVALHLIDNKMHPFYTTFQRMIRSIRESMDRLSDKTMSDVIDKLCGYDLLIIDEVGVQSHSDFEKNILFDIIDHRYSSNKQSILISNLSFEDFKNTVGERVVDRIRDNHGKMLSFSWSSFRRSNCNNS